MTPPPVAPLRDRDWLDRMADKEIQRRRFLAASLASAAVMALPGCQSPTFDPNSTTWTFRRRSSGGSGNRN
jgi:hypothetical protein